jgi:hypothetical protein
MLVASYYRINHYLLEFNWILLSFWGNTEYHLMKD